MTYRDIISKKLKELRNLKDIKQIDMAMILNITQCNYSQLENGKRKIDIEQVAKIADEYDLPFDWFLGRDVETTKKIKYK